MSCIATIHTLSKIEGENAFNAKLNYLEVNYDLKFAPRDKAQPEGSYIAKFPTALVALGVATNKTLPYKTLALLADIKNVDITAKASGGARSPRVKAEVAPIHSYMYSKNELGKNIILSNVAGMIDTLELNDLDSFIVDIYQMARVALAHFSKNNLASASRKCSHALSQVDAIAEITALDADAVATMKEAVRAKFSTPTLADVALLDDPTFADTLARLKKMMSKK